MQNPKPLKPLKPPLKKANRSLDFHIIHVNKSEAVDEGEGFAHGGKDEASSCSRVEIKSDCGPAHM